MCAIVSFVLCVLLKSRILYVVFLIDIFILHFEDLLRCNLHICLDITSLANKLLRECLIRNCEEEIIYVKVVKQKNLINYY